MTLITSDYAPFRPAGACQLQYTALTEHKTTEKRKSFVGKGRHSPEGSGSWCGPPIIWTVARRDGPNHLGF